MRYGIYAFKPKLLPVLFQTVASNTILNKGFISLL